MAPPTVAERLNSLISEQFHKRVDEAMLEKFGIETITSFDFLSMVVATTAAEGVVITPEAKAFIDGMGYWAQVVNEIMEGAQGSLSQPDHLFIAAEIEPGYHGPVRYDLTEEEEHVTYRGKTKVHPLYQSKSGEKIYFPELWTGYYGEDEE